MRLLGILAFICVPLGFAHGFLPQAVEQESLRDITIVEEPETEQAFYGELTGFPHTYSITATEPFMLSVRIFMPDIETSKNNVSGIIIREIEGSGRVEEVTRLLARDAGWEPAFEAKSGDSFRIGPSFAGEVSPGTYRIEVNTPENLAKYVLIVGEEEAKKPGYFEMVRRIAGLKEFFGKSQFRIIESPYVYGPLLLIVAVLGFLGYFVVRPRESNSMRKDEEGVV